MAIETTNYNGAPLVGGKVVTTNVDVPAGTYYAGQALGMTTTTNVYDDLDTGNALGLEDFRAVSVATVTFTGAGRLQVYTATSELMKRGIVDGSGDQLTITQALIENARSNSIILKN